MIIHGKLLTLCIISLRELAETQEGNLCVTRDDVFFQWNEYDSIKDLNVDEFKSLEDLENAGYSVLRLDNGKFVTDYL